MAAKSTAARKSKMGADAGQRSRRVPAPSSPARRRREAARSRQRFESTLARVRIRPRLVVPWAALGATGWQASKAAALALLTLVAAALIWVHVSLNWFVYADSVQVEPLTYLQPDDVYRQLDLDGWNILWLRSRILRERLLAHPYVADAAVHLSLPNRVAVQVQEKQPTALWVTQDGVYWLLADGAALPAQGEVDPALPQIIDGQRDAAVPGRPQLTMDPDVMQSALALLQRYPELANQIRYNEGIGLNFPLAADQVWVYWGDGEAMETKASNLATLRTVAAQPENTAQVIDVRYLQRPYLH